jgi:hypothetical protein
VHALTPRGQTGWTGSDCSMPMCTQGFYDPFCADLPQAPGGKRFLTSSCDLAHRTDAML